MSVWESEAVLDAVLEALGAVHLNNPQGHHFGTSVPDGLPAGDQG